MHTHTRMNTYRHTYINTSVPQPRICTYTYIHIYIDQYNRTSHVTAGTCISPERIDTPTYEYTTRTRICTYTHIHTVSWLNLLTTAAGTIHISAPADKMKYISTSVQQHLTSDRWLGHDTPISPERIHTYIHTYTHTNIYTHMHTSAWQHLTSNRRAGHDTRVHTYIYTHIPNIHTYIHQHDSMSRPTAEQAMTHAFLQNAWVDVLAASLAQTAIVDYTTIHDCQVPVSSCVYHAFVCAFVYVYGESWHR
jgi:hypothetical protein